MSNREILYTIKLQNETKAAIDQIKKDLGGALSPAAGKEFNQTLNDMSKYLGVGKEALGKYEAGVLAVAQAVKEGAVSQAGGAAAIKQMTNDTIKAAAAANEAAPKVKKLSDATDGGTASFGRFYRMVQLAIGAVVGNALLQTADQFTDLTGKIRTNTNSQEEAVAVRQKLIEVAMSTHTSMDQTVEIYDKLAVANTLYGKSQNQVIAITKTMSQGFQVGGATASAAAGAIAQFGLALASGQMRGQAFNSMLRQAPQLAEEMEKAMGKPAGSLRELIRLGKLPPSEALDAIQKAGPAIAAEYAKLPMTMKKGFEDAKTGFMVMMGTIGESMGASNGIGNFFARLGAAMQDPAVIAAVQKLAQLVGGLLNTAFDAVANTVAFLRDNLGLVATVVGVLTFAFLANAVASATAAGGILNFAAAKERLAAVMVVLHAIMALNPFVLLAIAVVAATAAIAVFGDYIAVSSDGMVTLKDVALAVWSYIQEGAMWAAESIADTWNTNIQQLKEIWATIAPYIEYVMGIVVAVVGGLVNLIINFFSMGVQAIMNVWNNFPGFLDTIWTNVKNGVRAAVEYVVNAWQAGLRLIAAGLSYVNQGAANGMTAALNATKLNLGRDQNTAAGKAYMDQVNRTERYDPNAARNAYGAVAGAVGSVVGGVSGRARDIRNLRNMGGGGGDSGVNLDAPGTRQNMAERAGGKGGGSKQEDPSVKALENLEDFIKKLKEATAASAALALAEWAGPAEVRRIQLVNAETKAVTEQTKRLEDAKKGLSTTERGKALIDQARAAAGAAEMQKQQSAAERMLITAKKASEQTLRDVEIQKGAIAGYFLAGAALADFVEQRQIQAYITEKMAPYDLEELERTGRYVEVLGKVTTAAKAAAAAIRETKAAEALASFKDEYMGTADSRASAAFAKKEALWQEGLNRKDDLGNNVFSDTERANIQRRIDTLRPPTNLFTAMRKGFTDFVVQLKPTLASVGELIQGIGTKMADTFVELAVTGKANFGDLARSIIKDLLAMIVKAILFKAIMAGLNAVAPGLGSFVGAAAGATGVGHTGGIAGDALQASRTVNSLMFAGAPRYHSGGLAGLGRNEVPIIAEKGEAILPTVRLPNGKMGVMAAGAGGGNGGTMVNANITINNSGGGGGMDPETNAKMGRMIEEEMNTHLSRKLEQWQRPGGPLDRTRR